MSTQQTNRQWRCDHCRKSLDDVPLGPVLHDHVWAALARSDERLCADCTFARAADRGVTLTLAALRPCPFNLFDWPNCWFDLMRRRWPPSVAYPDADAWRVAWLDEHPQSRAHIYA